MKHARFFAACTLVWCGYFAGCISPAVTKVAKQPPKPSQDEFSCGEPTPPRMKALQLQQSYPAAAQANTASSE